MKPVRFTSVAQEDLMAILEHYSVFSATLPSKFNDALELALEQLRHHPESGIVICEDYRRLRIHGFPYVAVYENLENECLIYGLFHTARHPDTWTGRVNEDPVPYGKEAITMEPTAPNLKEALYQAGLCLPEEERVALGQRLLHSVRSEETPAEVLQEARRRFATFDEGKSESAPMRDVIQEMREQLG